MFPCYSGIATMYTAWWKPKAKTLGAQLTMNMVFLKVGVKSFDPISSFCCLQNGHSFIEVQSWPNEVELSWSVKIKELMKSSFWFWFDRRQLHTTEWCGTCKNLCMVHTAALLFPEFEGTAYSLLSVAHVLVKHGWRWVGGVAYLQCSSVQLAEPAGVWCSVTSVWCSVVQCHSHRES